MIARALFVVSIATAVAAQPFNPRPHVVRVDMFAACNDPASQNAAVADAVTAATGGTLFIPKGCQLTLSEPTFGQPAVDVPANTTIEGESPATSGFALARRYCTSGSYIGAACATDTDCRGGTCGCDTGSGSSCMFAPTAGLPYIVIKGTGDDSGVKNIGIRVRQTDNFGRCAGGADANLPCVDNANCTSSYCSFESGQPAGAGDVYPLQFTGKRTRIENVNIYDHRTGQSSAWIQDDGLVSGLDNTLTEVTEGRCEGGGDEGEACTPVGANIACATTLRCTRPTRDVDHGVYVAGVRARVYDSTIGGTRSHVYVIAGAAAAKVQGNDFLQPWGTTTAGVLYAAAQGIISNNQMGGQRSCFEVERQGVNSTFEGNHCFESIGQKAIIQNAGHAILRNYLAWGPVGVCDSGSRAGKPCTTDDTTRGTGCPGATCPNCCDTPSQAVEIGAPASMTSGHWNTTHLELIGNRLHTSTGGAQPMVRFMDGPKRCDTGARIGLACTLDSTDATNGCGAGAQCPGCCDSPVLDSIQIAANHFYTAASVVGVDLSALTSSATASAQDIVISGNQATIAGGTFLKMPTSVGKVTDVLVVGNGMVDGTTFAANWDWRFGARAANVGIPYGEDEEPQVTRGVNASGSTIAAGTLVEYIAGGTVGQIRVASSTNVSPMGVCLHSCADGATCWIGTGGVITVAAPTGAGTAMAVGDIVIHDGANAGKVKTGGTSDPGIGWARNAKGTSDAVVPVLFRPVVPTFTAATYPLTIWSRATPSNTAQNFLMPFGASAGSTETAQDTGVRNMTVQRMFCSLTAAPGSGKTRTCSLRKNAAAVSGWSCTIGATALSCCITTAASGCATNNATAATFSDGDLMAFESTPSGGTAASADMAVAVVGTVGGF